MSVGSAERMHRCVLLPDGRRLGYAEYGDSGGSPVFFLHGQPGSRLGRHHDESIATGLGARIVAVDRPGYGLSDYQSGRRLVDWPADVVALAEALNLGRFAVASVSNGGPYALACAALVPER